MNESFTSSDARVPAKSRAGERVTGRRLAACLARRRGDVVNGSFMSSGEVNDSFMSSRRGGSVVLPDFAGALSSDAMKGSFMAFRAPLSEPGRRKLSSDRAVADSVRGAGAHPAPASVLVSRLSRV
ncbi:hypothetical protein [Amycolatopsis sp. SID8362]|uniref:hypothetical protein n=1 Tax=Amycolatopsis sp. SID8362 TaxID=2690346 RepID=UPI00136C39EC|nr:hypothetical protein [Amycolatopsis sp. SID8362]NBH04452.1 hypothetical protein [Amycolatopsis sp. SID8362]